MFGCGDHQDSIEHYMMCPHVEAIWERIHYGREWGTFESRLAVGCQDACGRISRVFFLYGIFSAYNMRRHGNLHNDVVVQCSNVAKQKITYALGKSGKQLRQLHLQAQVFLGAGASKDMDRYVGDVIFNFRKRSLANVLESSAKRRRSSLL